MYDELVKHLRFCGKCNDAIECDYCEYNNTTEYVDRACSDRLMLQAADAIEELSKHRWIPVTERLPEVDQPVMICAFGKSVGEGVYRGHDGFHHVWKMYTSSGTYWDDEVTHWMPLPQPPKEE